MFLRVNHPALRPGRCQRSSMKPSVVVASSGNMHSVEIREMSRSLPERDVFQRRSERAAHHAGEPAQVLR